MATTIGLSRTRSFRSRVAAAFTAAGLVAASSGLVMLAAPAATAGSYWLCHSNSSDEDGGPYKFQDLGSLNGHDGHFGLTSAGPDRLWDTSGVWLGNEHAAGDFRPDFQMYPDEWSSLADAAIACETGIAPGDDSTGGGTGGGTGGDDSAGGGTGGDDSAGGGTGGDDSTGGGTGSGGGPVTPTNVLPLEPTWVEATCSTSAMVEYRSVDGVEYTTEGSVASGNRVVVRAAALAGHSFANGTVTWWVHTFETPQGCGDRGTDDGDTDGGGGEEAEPNEGAKPSPTVKGVQKFRPQAGKGDDVKPGKGGPHAVPTAVAAGLTDLSGGHGSPSTFSSPQLAQALVAGGLLLLVVGGGLGLGRRANGAHEF